MTTFHRSLWLAAALAWAITAYFLWTDTRMPQRKPDFSHLPMYAREEINRLTLEGARKDAQLANVLGTTPSSIEVDPYRAYADDKPRLFLPDRTLMRYAVHGGYVTVRWDRGELYVNAIAESTQSLAVIPAAGTALQLRFVDRIPYEEPA